MKGKLVSDLFKPEIVYQGSVSSYWDALCKGTSIDPESSITNSFPQGWVNLLHPFVKAVQNDTNHYDVNVRFGELEVSIEPSLSGSRHYHILKAAHELQNAAKATCMQCGKDGKKMIREKSVIVTCRSCYLKEVKSETKETGTWLDNY